jgi:electron transfer flavoprotein beta subunit
MIKRIGPYDLILTGRQAGDWDFGLTGLLIAEILQIPSINLARKVTIIDNNKVLVEKLNRDGYQVVSAPMPVLVTVSSEVGDLRYTSVLALRAVSSKPVKVYGAADLEIDQEKLETRHILKLVSNNIQRECRYVKGESSQERGENLAIVLREDGVI